MSTPGQPGPDGAWQLGSGFGQGEDEDSVRAAITTAPRAELMKAVGGFDLFRQKQFDTAVDHTDGQNSIRDRIEYLANTSGYASAYMDLNWQVPRAKWVRVPFPSPLGPQKRGGVDAAGGQLVLKAGGLWQIWVVMNDWSYNWYYTPPVPVGGWPNGGWLIPGYTTYYACAVAYLLEVVSADGTLLASERFDAQSAGSVASRDVNATRPGSSAFECSVVLEDMPDEDDPTAPAHWAYVRVAMYVDVRGAGLFSGFSSSVYGGTKKSSLLAIRWSRDVANVVHVPTVDDGGILT